MGKVHKNCTIGKILSLRHITGKAFITRMKLYVYIVEATKTRQNIYSHLQLFSFTNIVDQMGPHFWLYFEITKIWQFSDVSEQPL